MRDRVVYESRLELARLLYADFRPGPGGRLAQPFLLITTVDGRRRRHVPDLLVLRERDVPLIVDVKPHQLAHPPQGELRAWRAARIGVANLQFLPDAAGNEVLVRDGPGHRFRLSSRAVLASAAKAMHALLKERLTVSLDV